MERTSTNQTFEDLSKEVVERFLQTAVVLDDGAFLGPSLTESVQVNEPEGKAAIPDDQRDDIPVSVDPHNYSLDTHSLDTQCLTTSFARRGIICAVLKPSINEDLRSVTIDACRRADILILDWQIQKDNGKTALDIIRRLTTEDRNVGGRMRLIAIYTGELHLERIRKEAFDSLSNLGAAPLEDDDRILTVSHSRILFVRKGLTNPQAETVSESDLPEWLLARLVEIGKGILINVALSCIAAIRDTTHQILARFRPKMDAPFLTHRILLVTPEDAENYAVDLLASEFSTILQDKKLGTKYAGRDAIQAALRDFEERGRSFQVLKSSKKDSISKEDSIAITQEDLMKLIDSGPEGLTEIANFPGGRTSLHERLYLLFSDELRQGKALHLEFSRISIQIRDPFKVAPNYQAELSLGTVVRRKSSGEYLVCIQPVCDALRLSESTPFIFASLSRNAVFDVVVRDLDSDEDIRLKLNHKASKIQRFEFEPDSKDRKVLTLPKTEPRAFKSTCRQEFIWICDLRVPVAQHFVQLIANDLSRIGFDKFEWLRRQSRGR